MSNNSAIPEIAISIEQYNGLLAFFNNSGMAKNFPSAKILLTPVFKNIAQYSGVQFVLIARKDRQVSRLLAYSVGKRKTAIYDIKIGTEECQPARIGTNTTGQEIEPGTIKQIIDQIADNPKQKGDTVNLFQFDKLGIFKLSARKIPSDLLTRKNKTVKPRKKTWVDRIFLIEIGIQVALAAIAGALAIKLTTGYDIVDRIKDILTESPQTCSVKPAGNHIEGACDTGPMTIAADSGPSLDSPTDSRPKINKPSRDEVGPIGAYKQTVYLAL
jgi:hypothetical protein